MAYVLLVALRRRSLLRLLADGAKRLCSDELAYEFRYDLESDQAGDANQLPFFVRPFVPGDSPDLFPPARDASTSQEVAAESMNRLLLLEANLPTPYVVVAPGGDPCYINWMLLPESNDRVRAYFKGYLPVLAPDEVMLEGAFMAPLYRSKGIFTDCLVPMIERARQTGARWLIVYIKNGRIASIRGVLKVGFHARKEQRVKVRFFRYSFSSRSLSEAEAERLETSWLQAKRANV